MQLPIRIEISNEIFCQLGSRVFGAPCRVTGNASRVQGAAARYKQLLMAADEPRHGALDGRGNLTGRGLREFSEFFLGACLDQVEFMANLLDPSELLRRMEIWSEEEIRAKRLPRGSWQLLREEVIAGSFPRGKTASITGYEIRQARTVMSQLIERGLLVSDGHRADVRLGFPVDVVERWLPRLYIGG